jgi:riboflavin kinase/FMN adenylyltransferase
MNIGVRPTFENSLDLVIEVHIFDFEKNIYGEEIKIELLNKIRDEKKFSDKSELIDQMKTDKEASLKIINEFN